MASTGSKCGKGCQSFAESKFCLRHQIDQSKVGLVFLFFGHHLAHLHSTKMVLGRTFYNTIVKKNSVFVATIFASAFAFEVAFDTTTTKVWDNLNKGVSTLNISFIHGACGFSQPVEPFQPSKLQ